MHRLFQPALILILATLLAVGPGWCRMHCAAANDFEAAPAATCCHAEQANTSPQQHVPAIPDCRCQIQPVTNEVRGLAVDQPTPHFVDDLSGSPSFVLPPVRMPCASAVAAKPSVPIHVLKCVWRC